MSKKQKDIILIFVSFITVLGFFITITLPYTYTESTLHQIFLKHLIFYAFYFIWLILHCVLFFKWVK